MATEPLAARFLSSLTQIPARDWNALTGTDYPFIRHEFLLALEQSGASCAKTGWQPCHLTLYQGDELVALLPLYLKSHSWGEYVFDWAWANAWRQHGLNYYPKLLTAIPFTPATGPRLCIAPDRERTAVLDALLLAIQQFAGKQGISSWHLLFPEREDSAYLARQGLSMRSANQFHWFNRGYGCFDDFLAGFNSRKRKSLRRERRRVTEQGIALELREGTAITASDWDCFYRFYQRTYAKRSGHGGYLNREFFQLIGRSLPQHCLLVTALQQGEAVAGALYFKSADTLYGRYWGCSRELDCLHFEACYYQGIEYCIANGLQHFDPGAQGEHKIQRGFEPVQTRSNHWIADSRFAAAIADFVQQEGEHIDQYMQEAARYLPYRQEH